MLQTKDQTTEYVIQIVSQQNPIKVRLPTVPGMVQNDKVRKVIIIDSASFIVQKNVTTPTKFISAKSDFVKLLFSNGFGCFNKDGKMTQVLQVLQDSVQIVAPTYTRQIWSLTGSSDPFLWSVGYQLQLGFSDIDQNPLDFTATGLNTYYQLIIQINIQ